jgi:D-xylose reductase
MMNVPALELSNGSQMPVLGLGMWKVENAAAPGVVEEAVRAGWRHFDCASDYGNEADVGIGLQRALQSGAAKRDQLWITSKLWNTNHARQHVREACEKSLRDLKLDYLDLYLIHFPIALEYVPPAKRYPAGWFFDPEAANPRMKPARVPISETWGAMEELLAAGVVKNIGVSNFNTSLLRDMHAYAKTPPAVLQVEMHPYLTQEKLVRFCREEKIAVTAFSPLGAPSYVPLGMATHGDSVMNEPIVRDAAARHKKTPAQIVLHWAVQRGTAAIPKTTKAERLHENISIFDFELSADEMNAISALDRNRRFNDPGVFCEKAFNTFFPIYE